MSITPFPQGISVYGMPIFPGYPFIPATTGNRYFVYSGTGVDHAGVYGKSPDQPFATIDYAVGHCTASQGDQIIVLPGHAENLSAATSLVVDVAGIAIIGLGWGETVPTLSTTAAAGTVSVTAANVLIDNIKVYSNFETGTTAGFTLAATADGAILRNIKMREAAATSEFLIGISVAAGCHEVDIDGLDYRGVTGGSTTQAVKFVGASNYSRVRNFTIMGDFSGAAIDALTAASLFMEIGYGRIINDDTTAGLSVSVKSDTTGMMHHLDITALNASGVPAGAAMAYSQVYVSNVIANQGFLQPAADS